MLLDAVISRDRNAVKEEAEKILKYKETTIETQRTWYVKRSDTRYNTGKTWPPQNHLEHIWAINLERKRELQQTTILGTARILQNC